MKTKSILALASCWAMLWPAFAGVEQTVNDLVPKLAAATVEARYGPQMELQALAANASRPGAEAERAELAKVLAAKAADAVVPQPARVWVVRQLEYIGAAESVAALIGLLSDPDAELKECARRALEKNSAPAAAEALRAALQKGGPTAWTIGLVRSLGERADAPSVSIIAPLVNNPELSGAATAALGKIANDSAVKALWAAFDQQTPSAADALVQAANRLAANGDTKAAAAIYAKLYTAHAAPQLRAAALIGLAKTSPSEAQPCFVEALSANDARLQTAAITAAPEIYGKEVSAAVVTLLPKLNPSAKVLAVRLLHPSAEKQVIALADDPDSGVRLAALETLGRIGGAPSLPVLLKSAAQPPSAAQRTAALALARISGPGTDTGLADLAAKGDAGLRAAAINALAGRNDRNILSALLKYAAEPDRLVNSAACAALGKMGGDQEVGGLVELALAGKTPGAGAALQAVASRALDKSAAAKKLIALTQNAAPQQVPAIFDVLAMLGGDEALAAITQATASSNDDVKDAAVRALANWPDFAAAKPLLALASAPEVKRLYNILAVQGVARLVKSCDKEPAAARLDAALAAMTAARRDEEKKLLLSAIASVPYTKAADAIKPFLKDPKFKAEAGLAGVTLAEALRKTDRPAAKELAQAVKDTGPSAAVLRRADALLRR